MSQFLHRILLSVGIALAALVVWKAGPGELWKTIVSIGPGLGLLVFFDGVGDIFHAIGTLRCFGSRHIRPPFLNMIYIRLAGRAYSYFTPTSGFGGDMMKAVLLRRYVPAHDATAIVIIDKFTFAVAQFGLAFAGSAWIIGLLVLPERIKWAFFAISTLLWIGFGGFLVFQRQGRLKEVLWVITAVVGTQRANRLAHHLEEIDGRLQQYHEGQGGDLLWSILFHCAGFGTDILVTWMFLDFALQIRSWRMAAVLWSLTTWSDAILFPIPLGIGTQESIRALVFGALGLPWNTGVAYALIQRIAQIAWGLAGLGTHALQTAGTLRENAGPIAVARIKDGGEADPGSASR